MLSVLSRDEDLGLVGSKWVPAFAGMTRSQPSEHCCTLGLVGSRWVPAFAGMTDFQSPEPLFRGNDERSERLLDACPLAKFQV